MPISHALDGLLGRCTCQILRLVVEVATLLRSDNYDLRETLFRDFSSMRYLPSTVVTAFIKF